MSEDKVKEPISEEQEVAAAPRRKSQPLPPIELLYRQVFDLIDASVYGFETQIRINDKKLGTLTPDLFVPIAERSNQIVELGKWSFVEMSDMIRRQTEKGRTIAHMFMHVSCKYLCKSYFLANLTRQMEKASMAPESVCIVLHSQDLIDHANEVKDAIDTVHAAGIEVAIADVGSAGLSLMQFSELNPQYLIFDPDFADLLLTDERTKEIANTLSQLAVKLGAQLIAQGVDSKDHAAAFQSIGCSLMQGTYIAGFEREAHIF